MKDIFSLNKIWLSLTITKSRLFLLYFVVVASALVAIWQGGEALRTQQIRDLKTDSTEQLDQLANVLESAIAKYQHMPTLLAANDRVRKALRDGLESDINQLNRELEQINRITEALDSYIINPDGLTIAASNYRQSTSFVGQNFSFRPYFQDAAAGKSGRYYALGTMSNRRGYYFSYPVYEGDSIIGVAVVKVDLTQFEKRFTNQHYEFLLLDPDGIVFSSSNKDWLYQVQGELTDSELQRIIDSKRYRDRSIEQLAVVDIRAFDEEADVIDVLEKETSGITKRRSYLQMSRPIRLLGFKISTLSPLNAINEEIALRRAVFAGGVTITGLLVGLALLRSRMLRERDDANEMTRHNQAYIREVIQNTQAGLVTLDENFNIESFNPAVEKLLGQPLSPLVGQPLYSLFKPTDLLVDAASPASADRLQSLLLDSSALTLEGQLQNLQQQAIPVEITLSQMRLPNRRSYLVTVHDMTERKRYEQDITAARNELENRVLERTFELEQTNKLLRQEIEQHSDTQRELIQTAKLAVLGQLSAGLNHELNQPLTAIRAFADNGLKFLARENYSQAQANLEHIKQLGHHMGDIIARFKVFARKGDVQQGAIAVHSAILGAFRIMAPRYKEVDIELDIGQDKALFVNGDMVFLEQVLVNLLANAADAVEEMAQAAGKNRKCVQVLQRIEEGKITICVRDSGNGLSEQAQQHLFEPFFTSKSSGAGLGLGLSISQRIVEVMGGQISAHNLEQGGAEFCVTLPRFEPLIANKEEL